MMKAESRPHINAIPSPTGVVNVIILSRLENEEAPADDAPCDGFGFRLSVLPLVDRKSTRLNSSHSGESRMPSSA